MLCPNCDYDNIDGVELCAECGTSLVGVESRVSEMEQSIATHAVSTLCPRQPVCVASKTPVREVIARMAAEKVGCLLVEDDAQLVGVFSERDVLNKISGDMTCLDRPVGEFMTRSPFTVSQRDSIAYALQAMDLGGYRHLPVVNSSGIATGIISARDILRFLAVRYAQSRT
jgi:CBS domain-containing protein